MAIAKVGKYGLVLVLVFVLFLRQDLTVVALGWSETH